jgi:hypothetical protein
VEHDAYTETAAEAGTFSFTHTPVGTPSGVLVFLIRVDESSTDSITGVTYGGVSMTAVSGGLARDTTGELGYCKAYFLGTGVLTGARTVMVTSSDPAAEHFACAITVTSVGDTAVAGVTLVEGDGTLSEQSVNDGSPGSPSVRYAAGFSGQNTPPGVGSNSTSLGAEDFGTITAAVCRETTAGQGSRAVGFSSAESNDRAFVHLAVTEVP